MRGLAAIDAVDEYRLLQFPVVLGSGKRMLDEHSRLAHFRLTGTTVAPRGVAIHCYVRDHSAGQRA